MILRDFLDNQDIKNERIYFNKYFFHIEKIEKIDNIEYHIEKDIFIVYDRKWSKIILKNNYEEKKFDKFIQMCDMINYYKKIKFCVFEDNVRVNDSLISTLDFFTNFEHPIKKWKFYPNQPDFPFTINTELIASNIYHFEKFCEKMKHLLRYQNIIDLVEFVSIREKRRCDFLEILQKEYGYIESNLGDLIDKFCLEGEGYNYYFYLKFLPLIEKCLQKIKFLPSQYIKIY
jgi:hypothetical protein